LSPGSGATKRIEDRKLPRVPNPAGGWSSAMRTKALNANDSDIAPHGEGGSTL